MRRAAGEEGGVGREGGGVRSTVMEGGRTLGGEHVDDALENCAPGTCGVPVRSPQ